MEKQLKCVLLLSLKEIALRRVVVLLWSGPDILASISNFRFRTFSTDESKIEWLETIDSKIKDKVLKLELPESLKKQMIDIVYPIGTEIRKWKECHEDYFCNSHKEISSPDLTKLCWTTAGTIDNRKTAEELVHCKKLDVEKCYEIACYYCLEDYISLYWGVLPEEEKRIFGDVEELVSDLRFYWPHILEGKQFNLDYLRTWDRNLTSLNHFAFLYSAENGNKTAVEYFFQKLTHEEREASLMRTAHDVQGDTGLYFFDAGFTVEKNAAVLYCLLSLMTPEQQMEILKARPIDVVLCFLYWPQHDLFLENICLFWTFLSTSDYSDLLEKMAYRFEMSVHYFPKLFQEFFIQSPVDFKISFVGKECGFGDIRAKSILNIFFGFEDSESIEVIFRNMDAAQRLKLVFDIGVFRLFYRAILKSRWHMVEVCLREAMLFKEDRERLKEAFMGFLDKWHPFEIDNGNPKFKRFFQFLDETDDEEKKIQNRKLAE